jgi:signal peptidase II
MLYAIVAALVLILDQGLKYWISMNLALNEGTRALIPGIVRLTHVQNFGAAFSILKDFEFARWLFVAVAVVFSAAVIFALAKGRIHGRFGRWTALLVMTGALGNGIDRTIHGYVVDMFEFEFMHFAVFNVADILITVCGILFCLYILFHKEPEAAADRKKASGGRKEPPRNRGSRGKSGSGPSASIQRTPKAAPAPFINPFEELNTRNEPFTPGRVLSSVSLSSESDAGQAVHNTAPAAAAAPRPLAPVKSPVLAAGPSPLPQAKAEPSGRRTEMKAPAAQPADDAGILRGVDESENSLSPYWRSSAVK